jgi:hypothetical protein
MSRLFTEWLTNELYKDSENMLPPKLSDKQALVFLREYLLGSDWCVIDPISQEQFNTMLVDDILYKYSKKYRKECRLLKKKKVECDE